MNLEPDAEQAWVLAHRRGPLVVAGPVGTGKTWVLRERFARLIEEGADPERVALVVRTKQARMQARTALLARLSRPLPGIRVLTVHGLAHHVIATRFRVLGYEQPPTVLTAMDQFQEVQKLLANEDPADWPTYGAMLSLRGFADQLRQFVLRAQEALVEPEEIRGRAHRTGMARWEEIATFYERYLRVLDDIGAVDFAGLVNQAASAATRDQPLFDHAMVDDYQEATFAEEALLVGLSPHTLVVAGDVDSHVFSFQGTTDAPLRRFPEHLPHAGRQELVTRHRAERPAIQAWTSAHPSEEHAAAARELRRIHVEEGVPWGDLAVVVRRHGSHVGGLLRALDDAGVPRAVPGGGLSLPAEPAVFPFVLALRWLGSPSDRDGLIEPMLTSELVRLSPAAARGLVRAAQSAGRSPADALSRRDGLRPDEAESLQALQTLLEQAQPVADRSVLDAFRMLWVGLPYSGRLVQAAERSEQGRRALDAVLALSDFVAGAGEREAGTARSFAELLEAGRDDPGLAGISGEPDGDAVRVLTAHGTAGREFHTVVVVGAVEGDFPSLTRHEPMFDLQALEGSVGQSERNRRRLEDERRLFHVVATRARHRVLFTASDPHQEDALLTARSRFVSELGVAWEPSPVGPFPEPLSGAEAVATWRRMLADAHADPPLRLAALRGLLILGDRPNRWWFQRDWTETGRPLHENIRVSFSKLDTLQNCELQFVLSEELGLEGEAGYYAWVGHLVHSIIEDCERGVIDRSEEALAAAAQERWHAEQFPSYAVSEAFRRAVTERMLPTWLAVYGQTPALAGEIRFQFEFEGATVTGAIDRVGGVISGGSQITDYKTGKSRGAKAEDNLQLGIYYLAVNRAQELAAFRPVKQVELAFLKEMGDGPRGRVALGLNSAAQREFEKEMAERLSGLIGRVRSLIHDEVYRPDPGADCHWCDFKPLCPLWPEGRELLPQADPAPGGILPAGVSASGSAR